MKRLVYVLVVLLMLGWTSVVIAQDQVGAGGIWIEGAHSDTGDYAMENEGSNGWGLFAHYDADMDWVLMMKKNWKWGIKPGLSYHYLNWTKSHNKEREVCKAYPLGDAREWGCTSEEYRENETVNSQIIAATLKPYVTILDDFSIFVVSGAGMEVADDGEDNFAVYGGFGAEYFFTKNVGLSVQMHEIYSDPTGDYRRWETVIGAVEYRF